MSGQSTDDRDETSCECLLKKLACVGGCGVSVYSVVSPYSHTAISTASFSAFDYDMMDPLEHEWIMSAVQCSHEASQRLVETEPNLINKRVRWTVPTLQWGKIRLHVG